MQLDLQIHNILIHTINTRSACKQKEIKNKRIQRKKEIKNKKLLQPY